MPDKKKKRQAEKRPGRADTSDSSRLNEGGVPEAPPERQERPKRKPTGYLKVRLEHVSQMLIAHRSINIVKRAIMDQWGVGKRRAEQYCRAVFDIWAKNYEANIVGHAERAIADREELIRIAMANGEHRTALKAMDSRDRILRVLREHVDVNAKHAVTLASTIKEAKSAPFDRGNRIAGAISGQN